MRVHPAGLGVEADHLRALVSRPNLSRMMLRPEPARGAELRDLLEEVVVRVEEEGEPRRELVDSSPAAERRLGVGDRVGER